MEQLENVLLPFVFKLIKEIYPEYIPYFPHCLVKIHPIAQNSYLINPVSTKTGQDYFDLADSLSV